MEKSKAEELMELLKKGYCTYYQNHLIQIQLFEEPDDSVFFHIRFYGAFDQCILKIPALGKKSKRGKVKK